MKLPLFFFNTVPRNSLIQSLQVIYSREKGGVRTRCSETSVKSDFAFQATLVFPGLGTALLYQWVCFCELPAVCVHCPSVTSSPRNILGAVPSPGRDSELTRGGLALGWALGRRLSPSPPSIPCPCGCAQELFTCL